MTKAQSWARVLGLLACAFGLSCVGAIGGVGGSESSAGAERPSGSESPAPTASNPGEPGNGGVGPVQIPAAAPKVDGVAPAFMRRLTTAELGNAFQALLGLRPPSIAQIPKDGREHLFDRVAQGQTVTLAHVEAYTTVADEVADLLTPQKLGTVVPACATTAALPADGDALARSRRPCLERLIDDIGPLAFRRPVNPGKRATLLALYDGAGTYAEGLRQVVHGIFTSSDFLYVVETGTPVIGRPGLFALSDMEIATRLALFLCETIPAADAQLLAAANAKQLNQPEQVAAHAARLLDQPCARVTVGKFFTQWFQADKVLALTRDPKVVPLFTARAQTAMVREQDELSRHVTFDQKGKLPDLFTATYSFLNKDSAPLYGLSSASSAPERMELPPHRRGMLTQPALLTLTSPSDTKTSPVIRGKFVIEELLCRELPPPPGDVPPQVDDGKATARGALETHTANPACAGCHNLVDPVGFALEDFNPIGVYRTADRGNPVNPVGGIPMAGIENGKIRGGAELSMALSALPELRDCFATQWFRFGMARMEGSADVKSLWEVAEGARRDRTLRDVMLGLVRTYGFRHRAAAP